LHELHLEPRWLGWAVAVILAAYVLLTTVFSWTAPYGRELWQALRLTAPSRTWPERWFPDAQILLGSVAALLSLWIALSFDTMLSRLGGALTVLFLFSAGAVFSSTTSDRRATGLRYATLALGVVLLTEMTWALLGPTSSALWLYRSILLMISCALMTLVYGIALPRFLPQLTIWVEAGRRIGPVLGAVASFMLLVILAQEAWLFDRGANRTHMHGLAIGVVLLGFAALVLASINFAVIPGRDPFGLSERGRRLYVYAAELFFVLLFIHLRLTVPELFGGIFQKYWTLVVMAVAFLGVGLSEFFKRQRLPVLAGPLEQTGILLPLLPLLAFWFRAPVFLDEAAGLHYGKYALIWFLLGALYTLVAAAKRSFVFAFLAALAANFGLWSLLYHSDLSFLRHPQMWLIPFALIVLAAGEINKDRLREPERAAVRYLALLVIYISSTADMFIAGLGHSIFLPLVLAVLSIIGVLAGIVLRVRAFLYLGITFLFVVIFSMIWHAAVGEQQIWVWWASGIVLGAAIIALFAVFEKRRNDVLRVIRELRSWD
jgi:hypothetical protein